MMGPMAHPIHIHNLQFQVISRETRPPDDPAVGTLAAGFLDEGSKDTVLVLPGQRVRLLLKFQGYAGLYVYHCHNLEHEDMGMMRNYLVQA
jgi:FtsP/CotA-like multicopper oxidase with cupredoxin domain